MYARMLVALTLFSCLSVPLRAQESDSARTHREAVQRLMEVTNVKQMFEQNADAMFKSQAEQLAQVPHLAKVLREFQQEQLSWAALEAEVTQLYLESIPEAEVREITAFYESPLGQRMLSRMPVIMLKTNELGVKRAQAAMPILMEKLQAAMLDPGGI